MNTKELADSSSLRPLLEPRSVAVVGASREPGAIGYRIVEALVANQFQGPIYPVNPKASAIRELPCFPSILNVPEAVELAVIAVPSTAAVSVTEECGRAGVKALLVITAGFAEVGAKGAKLQEELLATVRAAGMRMVGPNCLGLLNTSPSTRLNASFSPVFPPAGRIAMSSQSGALGLAILASAASLGLGISQFVSVGNQADVTSNDLLDFWEHDPGTDLILLYAESFGDGRRFARSARRISRTKPIIALKSGRSNAGAKAASSHTAALATSDVGIDGLLRQTGVIRAESLEEMFDLARALASQPLPRGRRVGIITNAGGPAILCADACEAAGLVLPEFSTKLQAALAAGLPKTASVRNPVDMIASAGAIHYRHVTEAVLQSGEVDALIVIYIPVGMSELNEVETAIRTARQAADAVDATKIPILAVWMSAEFQSPFAHGASEQIPHYLFPEPAARTLAKLADLHAWRAQPTGQYVRPSGMKMEAARAVCIQALASHGPGWLDAKEVRELLSLAGLPLLPGGVAGTAADAVRLAEGLGYPVAVKLSSRRILHKTDIGGVRLNLRTADEVRQAFADIQAAVAVRGQTEDFGGVVVQPMFAGGAEVMIGMVQDRLLGPIIAFGLGGIHVEILKDVCFRVTPLTDIDAHHMVRGIRGFRLLQGYRGHPAADVAALEETLLRLSHLVEAVPEIQELDFNPIIALPPREGCRILDARVHVK